MLTGGGTGGHITPILAVAHELKSLQPDAKIIYIGERGGKYAEMTSSNSDIDEIYTVFAGKFRRYHGESISQKLLDIKTILLNVRDFFLFAFGIIQGLMLIRRIHPDVVFLKGGFVGVPIGIASAVYRLPYVTHDSDMVPGLANRLVSKRAKVHATAFPAKYYGYPLEKVAEVGVLVSRDYSYTSPDRQKFFKKQIKVPQNNKLLLITGGSGGASNINKAMTQIIRSILEKNPNLYVIHQTGKGKQKVYGDFSHDRLRVEELLFPFYEFTGASDLVVTRAGANTLAELGVQGKACIVVPNPLLTGGHQLDNAKYYEGKGAIKILDENLLKHDPSALETAIFELLSNEDDRKLLSSAFRKATNSDASNKLAKILLGLKK